MPRALATLLLAAALGAALTACRGSSKIMRSTASAAATSAASRSPAPVESARPASSPSPTPSAATVATRTAGRARATATARPDSTQPVVAATLLPADATPGVPLDSTLAPALLTLADLPSGWTQTDSSAFGNSASGSLFDSSSASTDLCGNDRLVGGLIGQDSTGFTPADLSTGLRFLVDGVARYQPGKAKSAMDAFQKALKACGGTTTQTDNNGATATLTVAPLKLPALGDQAAGFHVFGQSDPLGIGLAIVAVRKGDLLAIIADADLGADVPQDGLIQKLAAKAAARLSSVTR